MSQYNAQPDCAAEYAGWEAFDPELAPSHPTMDQSGGWDPPAHAEARQPVGGKAALPPNVGSVSLHAKAGFTGSVTEKCVIPTRDRTQVEPHDPSYRRASTKWNDNTGRGSPAGHSRVDCHPPHRCTACSISFPNNYQLEQHASKSKHKAYVCICGKAFTRLSALRRHIDESVQPREHQCPLCDDEFKRPGHVEQHLRLIHEMSKDAIKSLLNAQKSQPRQEPGQAIAASAVIPAGPTNAQVNQSVAVPAGHWAGPNGVSTAAPADHPGSRPDNFSALFSGLPTSGSGLVPGIPASASQSFMPQAMHPAHPAYQNTAAANHTGLPANTAPDFVGYLAAYPAWDLGLFNVDPATMPQNSVDAFGLPVLENVFMGEPSDFNFDLNFGNP